MGVNRCYSFMKCLLIILSIIFLCVGCGVCGLSVWVLWEGGDMGGGSESGGGGAARVGLAAAGAWGGALALGAALALAGAARGSAPLLAAAGALLALAAVAETAAAVAGVQHAPALRRALHRELHALVRRDYSRSAARAALLDALQRQLHCCGADGPKDWHHSEPGDALDLSVGAPPAYYWVPATCCAQPGTAQCEVARRVPASGAAGAAEGALYVTGCSPLVVPALWALSRPLLAAAGALLAAHAAALLLTLTLALRAPQHRYKA